MELRNHSNKTMNRETFATAIRNSEKLRESTGRAASQTRAIQVAAALRKSCRDGSALVLMLLAVLCAQRAGAAGIQKLTGHIPSVIQKMGLQPVGDLPDGRRLNLAIVLPSRDGPGLTNFLQQIYDPNSPNYHKFIKPDEYAKRFGPSVEDYEKLKSYFTTNGYKVTGTHPNRTVLDVNLSVAEIRKVFHVNLHLYHHPTEGRDFYAPDAEPGIETEVSILRVTGLDNYVLPRPAISKIKPIGSVTPGNKPALGSGPGGTYFAYDFRSAYMPNVTYMGNGQTVALFELDGYFTTDILIYEAQGGLPNVPLVNIPVDGFNSAPTPYGDPEVSLDIEMVIDMAPGLRQILVYEEVNGGFPVVDELNKIATDDLANQISSSWLIGDDPSYDVVYLQYAAQGQTFFQAAGDNGAYSPTFSDPNQQFADDPNITLVGGTTLSTQNGSWSSETVWNWNTEFGDSGGAGTNDAGGGGISTNYTIPPWQLGINMINNNGSTTNRNVPDVALTADNIYVVFEDGLEGSFGGTSCAAPLWAAFCALVNQKAQLTASPPMGFINPAIYSIAKSSQYSATFHDIITGNNTNADNPTNYYAVPGYDLCTGWGTPTGEALIDALVPASVQVPVLNVLSNTISGGNGDGMIDPDDCKNLTVLITNSGNVPATGVQGVLSSLTPGVIIGQSTAAFPNVPSGGTAQNQNAFTISTEPSFVCGTTVNLELVIKTDQVVETNLLQFATGTLGPPVRFDNSTPMPIPPASFSGAFSPIAVSGIGTIGKVTVSLYITDTYDEFMELQLISPNGTSVFLSLADGGLGANFGAACTPDTQRTTFDDAAAESINLGSAPLIGTYSPVTPLSALNLMTGTNANGIWQLNAINEFTGAATINCWSLFISPELCATGHGQCPGADLSLSMSANPISTPVGGPLTYTLSVSNAGPSPASNSVFTLTLPLSVVYQGAVPSQGSVSQLGNVVTFSLGTVGIQSNATIIVSTVPTAPGLVTATGIVGSPAYDPNPENNSASASVLVTKPFADLAVTMSANSVSVPVNGQATFSISVTNNGPATALGVTLTNFLPANANLVSGSSTQGTVAPGGTIVSVGTLAPGTGAVATLVLSPTVVGTATLVSTAGLDPSESDPLPGNNTARVSITVVPAADLGVSVVVSPNPAVSGGNFTYVVSVTNGGPATASIVTMNQVLPSTVTFISTSQASAVDHNGVISWSLTNMPGGTVVKLTNTVTAPTLLPGVPSNNLVSTFTVFGQPADPQTNNNFLVVNTIELRPMAVITAVGTTLTSESFQPPNGAVDPGETVGVQFQLANVGNIPTTNLVATLQTNGGVVPVAGHGQATYGALAPGGGTATGQFMFTASPTNGQQTIVALLQLQDGATNLGLVGFTFYLPAVSTFWNYGLISIPSPGDVLTNAQSGMAAPYPSSNLVFGITTYVSSITVTVSNLEHTFPHDINMLLVGPGGQSSILMAAAANHSSAAIPVTITFDQSASSPVPASGSLVSGSYQPAEYNSPIFTNVPNISAPYNTSLGVFAGVPANGEWNLYIYDGATGDYGAISNGWGLTVTTITPVNQITDIGAGIAATPAQLTVGGNVNYAITVTNSGTNAATVFLTNTLSSGLTFISNTPGSMAPYQQIGQAQYYNLGTVPGTTNVTVGFVAATTGVGTQTSTAAVGSSLIDPNTNNNVAVASISVAPPTADISAAISASITSNAVIGSNVIYTLSVSNGGPDLALNVAGVLAQGVTGSSNVVFSNNFGNIASATVATALFTNVLAATGQLTNTWTVTTASADPVPTNNVATLVFGVSYPEPVIVGSGQLLVAESFVPPNGAIDSNETVTVSFTLANIGAAPTTNLTATLQAVSGVIPVTTSQSYGVISSQTSSARNFSFTARGIPGSTITAVLSLSDNGYALGTVSFPFVLSATLAFTNNAAITIPDYGPATPYPAGIAVSTTNAGVIGKVTATLLGFTHTYPHDVNVLLIGPSGQKVVLMAHAGGPYSVTNLNLTFDGNATTSLPATNMVSGTNLPTLILPQDVYPEISGTPTATALGVFNGGNPNGLWSLYVYDDTEGNSGNIINGWALNISLVNPINPPNSLAMGLTHSPDPVVAGNYLTYQISVTNIGTSSATNVNVTDTLPPNVVLNTAAASQGTVNTNTAGVVSIALGTIANAGGTASATVTVLPQQAGQVTNVVSVTNTATGSGAIATDVANVINLGPFLVQATSLNRNLRLVLQGQSGQNYVIQTSTNLVSWTAISTNLAAGSGSFTFTNSLTNGPELFYRAVHFAQ